MTYFDAFTTAASSEIASVSYSPEAKVTANVILHENMEMKAAPLQQEPHLCLYNGAEIK